MYNSLGDNLSVSETAPSILMTRVGTVMTLELVTVVSSL